VGARLRQVAWLLEDFDAAAINAFVPLAERLTGLVAADSVDALRNAINGFDFATAGELLRQIAEELRVPINEPG
jgi:hypothetical protein